MDRINSSHEPVPLSARSTRKALRHASRANTTYARFVDAIASAGAYPESDAEDYALAVIATLEEILPIREISKFEAQLPSILGSALNNIPILDLPTMQRDMFCHRVAMRLGVTHAEAESITSVVFTVLRSRISAGESRHIEDRLPSDLRILWQGSTRYVD